MTETDKEFLRVARGLLDDECRVSPAILDRLFALARRGAEMNDAVKCHKEPEHQDRRYNVAERLFGDDH